MLGGMSEVDKLLTKVEAGNASTDTLFPIVYEELKGLAAAKLSGGRLDQTLNRTALVHEVYVRLVGASDTKTWKNRRHFLAAAAQAMRCVLVDSARAKGSIKRGGNLSRVELQELADEGTLPSDLLLDLDAGLAQLAKEDAVSAELVNFRLFAGLSVTEAGEAMGISRSTTYENWEFARSWLAVYLERRAE